MKPEDRWKIAALAVLALAGTLVFLSSLDAGDGRSSSESDLETASLPTDGEPSNPRRVAKTTPSNTAEVKPEVRSARAPQLVPGELAVRGRVLDASGHPIPAARVDVAVDPDGGGGTQRELMPFAGTRTDREGRFDLRGLVQGESYQLAVQHDQYRSKVIRPIYAADPSSLETVVRLQPKARIEGTVVDSQGAPLPSAKIEVFAGDARQGSLPTVAESSTTSDAAGRYLISGLDPGTKRVLASAAGHASEPKDAFVVSEVDELKHLDFVLSKGGSISGRVVDDQFGTPVAGIRVEATIAGHVASTTDENDASETKEPRRESSNVRPSQPRGTRPKLNFNLASFESDGEGRTRMVMTYAPEVRNRAFFAASAVTEADGSFVIEGLIEAPYLLAFTGVEAHDDREWLARSGDRDLVLQVRRRPGIRGRVVDAETGEPIREFQIVASPVTDRSFAERMERQSIVDAQGRFTIYPSLTSAMSLHVWADGFASALREGVQAEPLPGLETVITLSRGAVVEGFVRARDGQPITAAVVTLIDPPQSGDDVPQIFAVTKGEGLPLLGFRTLTDASGHFELGGVPAGRFMIGAVHADFAESKGPVFVTSGEGRQRVEDVTLGPGATLFGKVPAAGDEPGSRCRVLVTGTRPGAPVRTIPTAPDGSFRCESLPAGSYRVVVIPMGDPDPSVFLNAMGSSELFTIQEGEEKRVF